MDETSSRHALALALALAASAAPAGAAPQAGAPARVVSAPLAGIVVDASGTPMGPYYPLARAGNLDTPAVLLSLAGRPVLVPLRSGDTGMVPDSMEPGNNLGYVFFETTDCSGQGWLLTSRPAGVAAATVLFTSARKVLVYLPSTEPPAVVTTQSVLETRGIRKTAVCQVGGAAGRLRKVDQVIDLSTLYATPYRLQ